MKNSFKRNLAFAAILCLLSIAIFAPSGCKGKEEPAEPSPVPDNTDIEAYKPKAKVDAMNLGLFSSGDPTVGDTLAKAQIERRMDLLKNFTPYVRTFGAGGNQSLVPGIAKSKGLKVVGGIWLGPDPVANAAEIARGIAIGQSGNVETLVVGSETLLRGDLDAAQLIGYIEQVHAAVPGVYVTTADTYEKLLAHPDVVNACDLIFANAYPFWEGEFASCAVFRLHRIWQELRTAFPKKAIAISETGWPTAGDPVGNAVPSEENACQYIKDVVTWSRAYGVRAFLFNSHDEPFKEKYEGAVGGHWGIFDRLGHIKPCFKSIFDGHTGDKYLPCFGAQDTATVAFYSVPKLGSSGYLKGCVAGVKPEGYAIAVLIKVGGVWWSKPTYASLKTPILPDGSWSANVTTGGNDAQATELIAFLVPSTYSIPAVSGATSVPAALVQNSIAFSSVTRQ